MKENQEFPRKEQAGTIALCILYPFLLLFSWMGKSFKLFNTKKRQMIASVLSLVMVLAMLPFGALTVLAADTNLIVNPGGEITADGNTLLSYNGWNEDNGTNRGYSYEAFNNGPYDSGIILSAKSGTYFMGFYATGSTTYPDGVSCYQDIAVSGQLAFNFSGYVSLKKDNTGSAMIIINALNSSGGVINTWANTVTSADGDWKQVTVSESIPAGTAKLRVTIKGVLNSTGLAAFDDLTLTLGDTATSVIDTEGKLRDAINNVANGGTITLGADIALSLVLDINSIKSFTIDLNGKKIDAGSLLYAIYISGGGTLTITDSGSDGKIICNSSFTISLDNNRSLIISDGTVEYTGSNHSAIYNYSTGSVGVTGSGKVISSRNAIYNIYTGSVSVSDSGTVESTNGKAIYNGSNATVTISGGTVSASGTAIYNNSTGNINVSGGTVTSPSGNAIYNLTSGSLNISGGMVSSSSDYTIYNNSTGSVNLSGGVISSNGGTAIYNYSTGSVNILSGTPIIKGGGMAMNKAPDLSGYDNVQVTASTDISGANPVTFDETKIATYKYLAFAPGGAISLSENFDNITTISAVGWTMKNNSASIGLTNWFQGTSISAGGPFNSYNGVPNSYIAANYNNTGISNSTISNWLITPKLLLINGSTLTFYTRKPGGGQDYPDRLEVRMSTSGSNPGTAPTDIGDFTTLILSINPTLITNIYPTVWTKYTVTVSGLPEAVSGYLAFRYFVTNGGPAGINSDYIGIDAVSYAAGINFIASGYNAAYDGQSHGITLNVKTSGATVKYRTTAGGAYDLTTAPTFSNAGTYTVWYQISKDGYNTAEGSETVQITSKALTVNLAVGDKSYDGLNTATFSTVPSLVGVISGDQVTLVNGTPTFSSINAGSAIPINFTAFSITGKDAGNYSLTQPSGITANIKTGFTPVKDTHYTTTTLNGGWTNTDFVIAAKPGFQVSLSNTAEGQWLNSLPAYTAETTSSSVIFYVKNTTTGEISVSKTENYKIDKTAPTGEIKIGTNSFKTFLNSITFGLFFKDTTDVTITAQDTSGEALTIKYYLSETELTDIDSVTNWSVYQNKISLTSKKKYIVYAKLTDLAGNVSVINSDGVVVFTDSTTGTSTVNFTKTSVNDVTATVNLNGNTIKEIRIDGNVLTKNTHYTVSDGTITFKATYLNTLTAGNYTATVSYYPYGETGTPKEGSDTPTTTSIALTVTKAVPAIKVTANPTGTQTRPNSVTLSATLPAGATGTLQFKENSKNIGSPVDVGQTVSFKAYGSVNTYVFTVYYSGDDSYEPANAIAPPYLFVNGDQSALSFAAGTPTAKTYGDQAFTVTATGGSGTGAVTYSVVSGPATVSGNTVTLTGAGTVKIKAIKAADDDYNEKTVEHTITVNPKPVTITGVTAQSKTYDGSKTAAVSGTPTVSGKVSGDTVNVVTGTASFSDKTVKNGKTVSFSGFTLTGADAGKYTLTAQPSDVTANITVKSITMNIAIQSKAYDGLNTATIANAALNGVVTGDTVSLVAPYPTATFTSVGAANDITVSFGGNFTLTGADAGNYLLTQPTNIKGNITNNYQATKGTDYTATKNSWSNTDFVVTAKPGFKLSLTNTASGTWSETLTKNDETEDGNLTFYVRKEITGAISLAASESYQIDKTAPTGDIKIGESSIKKVLNTITFGLFFKETQTVTITSDDTASGVNSVYYKLSSTILEEAEVGRISDWTEYTETFTLEPDSKTVVYLKITDKVGNSVYLGSDGLVLDATAPIISGIENGKVYCDDVTVTVTEENLDTVTVDSVNTTLTDGKLTLSATGKAQIVIATDKAGNSTTVTVTVYDGHLWDEGVVTVAPTVATEGVKTFTCQHCGETRTEKINKIAPAIIEGQNGQVKQGTNRTLTFRSNAAFTDFLHVTVDGKEINEGNYTLKEGSIIVELKAEYLATLSGGKHTLGIVSVSGTADTEFIIEAKSGGNSPKTGDNTNLLLLIVLLIISAGIIAVIIIPKKRKK